MLISILTFAREINTITIDKLWEWKKKFHYFILSFKRLNNT